MTNIIGDIAGQYDALIKLVERMPEGVTISVGDMVDRGPDSKKVLDFFMKEDELRRAILGNHEHMLLDHMTRGLYYDRDVWLWNGGGVTIRSFDPKGDHAWPNYIPQKYTDWLKTLPLYIEIGDTLISHSFLRDMQDDEALKYGCELGDFVWDKGETTIIWNRGLPTPKEKWKLQVVGHNSQFGLREWKHEDETYAICIDDSRHQKLTGLHLETMTIYQEDF